MANKRCLPTRFFKDPDIMNLGNRDTQLILVGLVLTADDEGRELAHTKLLGRELDYPPEQIESALQELAANDLILLYQVGKHRYYSLTRWGQWQTLSSSKITLSKHPAPSVGIETPNASHNVGEIPTESTGKSGEIQGNPAQFNLIESNLGEVNGGEEQTTASATNITPLFPTAHTNDTTTENVQAQTRPLTQEVAHILKLPVCHALTRLVDLYAHDSAISLLIEADAAREWIDDRLRNRSGKPMTVTFFRTWLKRERKDTTERPQATGTDGSRAHHEQRSTPAVSEAPRRKNLMGLEAEYRATTQKGES